MLTLFETINAIKSLDTPKDVITQACEKVLNKGENISNDPDWIRKDIIKTYINKCDNTILMQACIALGGHIAGAIVSQGKEQPMMQALYELLASEFSNSRAALFEKLIKDDPDRAKEMLLGILK